MSYWKQFIRNTEFTPPFLNKFVGRIKRRLQQILYVNTIPPYVHKLLGSFSQHQEDLLIDLLFLSKTKGFYFDIGANDPKFNSNTKRFYDKGWTGINVEPGLNAFKILSEARPRDINLNLGVAPVRGKITFYSVEDNTLSSFDKKAAERMSKNYHLPITQIETEVWPMCDILDKYLDGKQIDFMSVDAEGFDLKVLTTNDWNKYRPTLLLVEINNEYHAIVRYLLENKYLLIFNNYYNGIFANLETQDVHIKSLLNNR